MSTSYEDTMVTISATALSELLGAAGCTYITSPWSRTPDAVAAITEATDAFAEAVKDVDVDTIEDEDTRHLVSNVQRGLRGERTIKDVENDAVAKMAPLGATNLADAIGIAVFGAVPENGTTVGADKAEGHASASWGGYL